MKSNSKLLMLAPAVLALGAIVGCNKNNTVTEEQWKDAINYLTGGFGDGRNFSVIKKFKEKDSDVDFVDSAFRVRDSLFIHEGLTIGGESPDQKIIYNHNYSFQNDFGTFSFGDDLKPWYVNDDKKNVNPLQLYAFTEMCSIQDQYSEFKFNTKSNSYKRDLPEKLTSDNYVYDVKFNNDHKIETVNFAHLNENNREIHYTSTITYGNAKEIVFPENKKFFNATSVDGKKLMTDAVTLEDGMDYILTFDLSLLKAETINSAKLYAIDSKGNKITDKAIIEWSDIYKNKTKLSINTDFTFVYNAVGIQSVTFNSVPGPNDKLVFNFYKAKIIDENIKFCIEIDAE